MSRPKFEQVTKFAGHGQLGTVAMLTGQAPDNMDTYTLENPSAGTLRDLEVMSKVDIEIPEQQNVLDASGQTVKKTAVHKDKLLKYFFDSGTNKAMVKFSDYLTQT